MALAGYKRELAGNLYLNARNHLPKGKQRRSWRRKAWDLLRCGQEAHVLRCRGCRDLMRKSAAVEVGCGLRTCPPCARRRSNLLRNKLGRLWGQGERPHRMGLYLLTFTLRYDPSDSEELSVEGLRRRKKAALLGWGHVWRRYLKGRGRAAVRSVEVSPRGAVHMHVLYHGLRPDIGVVRELWLSRNPGSPMVNVRYVHSPASGIAEVAKYVTKGASPARPEVLRGALGKFTDPRLAAAVEVAFSGDRLVECYGAWRGADEDRDEPEDFAGAACIKCGLIGEWELVWMPTAELAAWLGGAFRPSFRKSGPGPPRLPG